MSYKNKLLLELMKAAGRDFSNVALESGKFIKDAFLTEVVPRELKPKLKNYDPPSGYLKTIRPFFKMFGGLLAGSAAILLSNDSDLSTAMLRASPFYIYGLGDGGYEAIDGRKADAYLPPATFAIELPYSYFSNLHRRAKLRTPL